MKSRRVLQIIVAVLSIATLAGILLFAALMVVAEHIDVIPQQVVDFAQTFNRGLKSVADKYYLYDSVVPSVAVGAPALAFLLAIVLLLTKDTGKEAKNIVGCAFALVGAAILTVFVCVFAKHLFVEELLVAAFCSSCGLLAVFVVFVGCALGIKPKRIRITEFADEAAADEAAAGETVTETQEADQEAETSEEAVAEESDEACEQEEELQFEEDLEAADEQHEQAEQEQRKELDDDTPATQYVPHLGVTIQDVVDRTYGKDSDALNKATIAKINKVRTLYEAKAISEDEYIKLIRKYLGF